MPHPPTHQDSAAAIEPRHGLAAILLLAAVISAGCEPYRIEYRTRPGFYESATGQDLPDEVVTADGTRIVYRRPGTSRELPTSGNPDEGRFLIREELEDGRIVLRAIVPEHVLANLLTCLQNHEYELLFNELLAAETRNAYERDGKGLAEFAEFFERYRRDLATTANRMMHGLPRNEVVIDNLGAGRTRLRFHPTVGDQFKFRTVDLASESGMLKLVLIH